MLTKWLFIVALILVIGVSACGQGKRCEFVAEFPPQNPSVPTKTCAYRCRGYGALATFPWNKDLPCPPSFDGKCAGT